MISIGVVPLLANKPFMLERLLRDAGLQKVQGDHLHLVSASAKNPKVVKPARKTITYRTNWNGGGDAA
jgi:hypothetical protein